MRANRLPALALIGVLALSGCRGTGGTKRVAKGEPPLIVEGGSAAEVVEAPPSRPVTVADRHPLLSKPREYYDNSGNNKVVKVAAGTLIGVPAGIFGELRQIVRGQPKSQVTY